MGTPAPLQLHLVSMLLAWRLHLLPQQLPCNAATTPQTLAPSGSRILTLRLHDCSIVRHHHQDTGTTWPLAPSRALALRACDRTLSCFCCSESCCHPSRRLSNSLPSAETELIIRFLSAASGLHPSNGIENSNHGFLGVRKLSFWTSRQLWKYLYFH